MIGDVITRELVLRQEALESPAPTKLKELLVIDLVTLVHEHDDGRNVHLTGKKNVLTCLRHRTVCGRHHKDRAVHLSSTGDHVLYVVSVTRAIHVGVVTVVCLILLRVHVDGDTASLFFRSLVDILVVHLARPSLSHSIVIAASKSSAMVNVTNRAYVHVTSNGQTFPFAMTSFRMWVAPIGFC